MSKRIALLCMSLNIGGAETHIYELAKELHAQGNDVTVFSNGGVYAHDLKALGVHHIKTPLHTKKLNALVRSFFILLREFKKNRPSVVHSHTRISNTIGGLVCKLLRIPMVTTVHGHFKTNFIYRHFSNWGIRSLAVSEDLKKYLISNYNYNPRNVELTVNGIDMKRFKKQSLPEFRSSLGIKPDEKIILIVSRLDKDAGAYVFDFLNMAPEILKNAPHTKILIVGDGALYPSIHKMALSINEKFGGEYVRLEGARTNIHEYTAIADLYIGVSRSALEAMSSGVPTILYGNPGYLGLYSDEIKNECIETNLTCRGYPVPAQTEIIGLISECLNGRDLSSNIEQGQKLVQEYYSVKTMAETAVKQYNEAINHYRPFDYMISGYYGSCNFGDTFMLSLLTQELAGCKGTILTRDLKNTVAPEHVQLVHRFNLFKIGNAMRKTKIFILGGGSVLQDATSNRSFFYYQHILKMALRRHCKIVFYANGLGPLHKKRNIHKAHQLLNRAALITVRDPESLKFLQDLKIKTPTALTTDEVFSCRKEQITAAALPSAANRKTVVGINLKSSAANLKIVGEIAAALEKLAAKYDLFFYLLPLHLTQDSAFLKQLNELIPQCSHMAKATADPDMICRHIAACKYHIVERYHGQVMATILGLPYVPIEYDPKNSSLTSMIGLTDYALPRRSLNGKTLLSAFEKVFHEQDQIRDKMNAFYHQAIHQAQLNHQLLHQTIEDY